MKNWLKKIMLFSFFVLPASSNFKLEGFSFGAAGGGTTSTNYALQGEVGEVNGDRLSSSGFKIGPGLAFIRQANVPLISTFDNPNNYYNKLHFVIDSQNNSSDTKYAVAISPDSFTTTYYVKSDGTVGGTFVATDYQTSASWGDLTGTTVVGLTPSTTYSMKVKAMKGNFTETEYGPVMTAATVAPQLTYDIDVASTDSLTDPPYSINLGDLFPGTVVTSNEKIWVSLETNATSGGSVFVYGQNSGLFSVASGYTISSVSGDLNVLSTGFGAQGSSVSQSSGGPLSIDVGYTGSSDVVGITDSLVRQIFKTNNPVVSGRASFIIKAKSDNNAPAAADYVETLTIIAAANY